MSQATATRHPVIKLPDGTKCYSGPNCRVHGPAIAAARMAAPGQISDARGFEAALAEQRAAPKDTLAKGQSPRALEVGESRTYADVIRSGDKGSRVVTSVDLSTPPGHFIASVRMLGITTEYLVEGAEGDKNGKVLGRIELVKERGRIYRGGELKGGEYVGTIGGNYGTKTFADAFDDIAAKPKVLPSAPATTPGVFGLPAGEFQSNRYSPYDLGSYTANKGTVEREVRTNAEFKKAIKQVRAEPMGVVRVVRPSFNKNHGHFSESPIVTGPKDGTLLVVDMGRTYPNLEVDSGNVVVNIECTYGGSVKVRRGAAVTIIAPPSKFTVYAEAGAAVTVYPRAGAYGRVLSEEGASVTIDDTYQHEFKDLSR